MEDTRKKVLFLVVLSIWKYYILKTWLKFFLLIFFFILEHFQAINKRDFEPLRSRGYLTFLHCFFFMCVFPKFTVVEDQKSLIKILWFIWSFKFVNQSLNSSIYGQINLHNKQIKYI